ncbi:MAG: AAA family ATPase [Bacteriovoracaceae bacterium]|nr:AAA family ATPase [Bacteriovoracaceae bacterium]
MAKLYLFFTLTVFLSFAHAQDRNSNNKNQVKQPAGYSFQLIDGTRVKVRIDQDEIYTVYLNDDELLIGDIIRVSRGNVKGSGELGSVFFIETRFDYYIVNKDGRFTILEKKEFSTKTKLPLYDYKIDLDQIKKYNVQIGETVHELWLYSQWDVESNVNEMYLYNAANEERRMISNEKKLYPKEISFIVKEGINDGKREKIYYLKFDNQDLPIKMDFSSFFNAKTTTTKVVDGEGVVIKDLKDYIQKEFGFIQNKFKISDQEKKKILSSPEVQEMREALVLSSGVILGDEGMGKTYQLNLFIKGVVGGLFPELKDYEVINLNPAKLESGGKYKGVIEAKVNALIEYAKQNKCIIKLDEMHRLRGTGTHSGNNNDTFESLKDVMDEDGRIKIAGATTYYNFQNSFGGDPALSRRFNKIRTRELDLENVKKAVENFFQKENAKIPSEEILLKGIYFSNEYDTVGNQPAKAIELFKKAYAKTIVAGLDSSKLNLDLLQSTAIEMYGVDAAVFDSALSQKRLEMLPDYLDKHVIGMEPQKELIVSQIRNEYAGLTDPNKPSVVNLFTGARGSGKSELGKVVSRVMGYNFEVIDMTSYAHRPAHEFQRELGAILRKNPFSYVVLEEFEKASVEVKNTLLLILQDGSFTVLEKVNSSGNAIEYPRKIMAKHMKIQMNSNAGSKEIIETFQQVYLEKLKEKFGNLNHTEASELQAGKDFSDLIKEETYRRLDRNMLENMLVEKGYTSELLDRLRIKPALPPTRFEFFQALKLHSENFIKEQKVLLREIVYSNLADFLEKAVLDLYVPGVTTNRFAYSLKDQYLKDALAVYTAKHGKQESITIELDLSKIEKLDAQKCDSHLIPKAEPIGFKYGNN